MKSSSRRASSSTWLGLALLALALAACRREAPVAAEASATASEPGPFRVAVIMPGSRGDQGWCQSLSTSLSKLREEMGPEKLELTVSEMVFATEEVVELARRYAGEGYDLVIAHSSGYLDALRQVAPEFPQASFAFGADSRSPGFSNVFNYDAAAEQGGYLNGVLAAHATRSGVIGVIGPYELGDAKLYIDGFVAGARAADPTIDVRVKYIDSWSDRERGAELAWEYLAAGADVLTGTAVVTTAIESIGEGEAIWLGNQVDQSVLSPGNVLASQIYDWTVVLKPIIRLIRKGTYGGHTFLSTLGNGGLRMSYNDRFDWPPGLLQTALDTEQSIFEGTISTRMADRRPLGGGGGPLVFGMILRGARDDGGWSQSHYRGGRYVERELPGSRMLVFESLNPVDKPAVKLTEVVDEMVAAGARLVLSTSPELEKATLAAARKHPDVVFLHVSGDRARRGGAPANFGNLMGQMVHMKAVEGCAAALATRTGKLAYLGSRIDFETRRHAVAAYLGARHCWRHERREDEADLGFTVIWLGHWFSLSGVTIDPVQLVGRAIEADADVVLNGIADAEMLAGAARHAAAGRTVSASSFSKQAGCDPSPEVCLGATFFNWGPAFLEAARRVQEGRWVQSWEWLPPHWEDLQGSRTPVGWRAGRALGPTRRAGLRELIAGLASGDIDLWAGPLRLQDGTAYVREGRSATESQIWYMPRLLDGMDGASE